MSLIFVTNYSVYEVTVWYLKDFLVIDYQHFLGINLWDEKNILWQGWKTVICLIVKVAILQVTETFLEKKKSLRNCWLVPRIVLCLVSILLTFLKIILENFRGDFKLIFHSYFQSFFQKWSNMGLLYGMVLQL